MSDKSMAGRKRDIEPRVMALMEIRLEGLRRAVGQRAAVDGRLMGLDGRDTREDLINAMVQMVAISSVMSSLLDVSGDELNPLVQAAVSEVIDLVAPQVSE